MEIAGILDYFIGFVVMAGIYSVMALGLNVQWGFTGLFNIGIAGFFALGAYTSALLTGPPPQGQFEDYAFGGDWAQTAGLALGIDLWFFFGIAAAMLVCAGVALVIGYVTLRLNEDYLAIATLGIAESVRLFFLNEKWAANGSRGLYNIPQFLEGLIAPTSTITCMWWWFWGFWRCCSWPFTRRSTHRGAGCCGRYGRTSWRRRPAARTCPSSSCKPSSWAR